MEKQKQNGEQLPLVKMGNLVEDRKKRRYEALKIYRAKYPEKYKEMARKYYKNNLRANVLLALGSKCIRCGFSDIRALQIDHINGGGKTDRKNRSHNNYFSYVIKSVSNNEGKYQFLCANCNWIKRIENGEIGGKRKEK